MSPFDARLALAISEVRRDWEQILRLRDKALSVDPGRGDAEAALVALSLDHSYEAFESILLRLERILGLPARTGESWHKALLVDGGMQIEGVRPAIYPPGAMNDWEALLGFRHFLRHAYAVSLDPARLRTNTSRLDAAVSASRQSIDDLLRALEREMGKT